LPSQFLEQLPDPYVHTLLAKLWHVKKLEYEVKRNLHFQPTNALTTWIQKMKMTPPTYPLKNSNSCSKDPKIGNGMAVGDHRTRVMPTNPKILEEKKY